MSQLSLRQQIEKFDAGLRLDNCDGFYDWFCKDSSLPKKAETLMRQTKTFIKHFPKLDLDNTYVFFKNNCLMSGQLYDDFRICDLKTGEVIFTVVPRCGHKTTPQNERAGIHGRPDLNPNSKFIHNWKLGATLTEIYKTL